MSTQNKPRICEVLGVEVGEEFVIEGLPGGPYTIAASGGAAGFFLDKDGYMDSLALNYIINNPKKIIRKSKFTPSDLELLRHIRAVFGIGSICRTPNGRLWIRSADHGFELPRGILPGIKDPNDIVRIDQFTKEGDQHE